jgi:hypothetical protein
MLVKDIGQHHIELLKALIFIKILYAVQHGQDIFNLRIYKDKK